MKKLFLCLALSLFTIVSCNKLFPDETTTFAVAQNQTLDVISLGTNIAINYKITNPIKDERVIATPSEEWIQECGSLGNALIFTIAENESDVARSATITLVYTNIEHTITINQSAAGSHTEEFTEMEYLSGFYWGTRYGAFDDANHYDLILGNSDNCRDLATGELNLQEGNNYLFLSLYSDIEPENLNLSFNVPLGNYVLDRSNSATTGTVAELQTYLRYDDGKDGKDTEFVNGSVTVTEEGIYASFVDKGGKMYKYYCKTIFIDNSKIFGSLSTPAGISTLTKDVNIDFSQREFYASSRGDDYLLGKALWDCTLFDTATGDSLFFMLLTDLNEKIPLGQFPISTDLSNKQMTLPGYMSADGSMVWSWYILFTDDRTILGSAPLVDGELKIEDNGDESYTITIDVVDDCGNRVTGLCVSPIIQ